MPQGYTTLLGCSGNQKLKAYSSPLIVPSYSNGQGFLWWMRSFFFYWDYLIQLPDGSHCQIAGERSRYWWGQVSIQAGYSSHPKRLPDTGLNNILIDTERQKLDITEMLLGLKATSSKKKNVEKTTSSNLPQKSGGEKNYVYSKNNQ